MGGLEMGRPFFVAKAHINTSPDFLEIMRSNRQS
jgi:hypothetical protein